MDQGLPTGKGSALALYDSDLDAHKLKAEIQMLQRLRIGSRVAVKFSAKLNEHGSFSNCEPFTSIGSVVGLQLYRERGHVDIHFDGEDVPVSSFSPLEVMLIEPND